MAIPTSGALDSGITELFEVPFSEGDGGSSNVVPYPWPVSINGRPFVIDLAHYQWQIPDMVRQAIDFSASPGEQSFDTGGVWLRSDGDWSLGAGQQYHDKKDSEQRLFAESLGVDIWTHRQIKLLPATENLVLTSSTTLRMIAHGTYLYLMNGQARTLVRTINPQSNPPTFTTITGLPAADFTDITTDGNLIYIATTASIYSHDVSAGTVAAVMPGAAATTVADMLAFCDGWLICGVGVTLSSISAAGALTTIKTHPVLGFKWAAAVGAPQGIYAGGQGDDIAEIFHIGFDPNTGGLGTPIHVGELPRGEQLRSLAYYGSELLIGTSKGFRLGDIQSDGSLTIGSLIATTTDVLRSFGDDKFVYFGWTNYDATHTGVGRANLAEFRAKSQPAYATDIMADATQGAVTDVIRFAGRTYFAVSGIGFYREQRDGNTVAQGTVRLGKMEWGTFEPKTFLGLQMTTLPLSGTVSASVTDDAGVVTQLGTFATQGKTGLGYLLGAGIGGLSTHFDLTLTLAPAFDGGPPAVMLDSSGNGRHGQYTGPPAGTTAVFGKPGLVAGDLSVQTGPASAGGRLGSLAPAPSNWNANDMFAIAWWEPKTSISTYLLVDMLAVSGGGATFQLVTQLSGTTLTITVNRQYDTIGTSETMDSDAGTITAGKHMISASYQKSTDQYRFYVDGALFGAVKTGAGHTTVTSTSSTAGVAWAYLGGTQVNTVDEVALGSSKPADASMASVFAAASSGYAAYVAAVLALSPSHYFKLNERTLTGVGPTVRLVTSRALVVPHQIQRWVLPIICKEHVTAGVDDDVERSQDVGEVRAFFADLRGSGTPVVFQEGTQRRLCVVRDVAFPDGQVERWGNGRTGLQGLLMVTLDSTEG